MGDTGSMLIGLLMAASSIMLTGQVDPGGLSGGTLLPAFLPMVPGLAARLPGTDPLALAISVNIGSAMVDVSPLSTIGAMCIAAAGVEVDKQDLFRKLMIWGLSMSVASAVASYLFFGGWLL